MVGRDKNANVGSSALGSNVTVSATVPVGLGSYSTTLPSGAIGPQNSSGANIFAAVRIAKELAERGERGCVVAIVCDRGDRYFAPLRWEKKYAW